MIIFTIYIGNLLQKLSFRTDIVVLSYQSLYEPVNDRLMFIIYASSKSSCEPLKIYSLAIAFVVRIHEVVG